jgi:hypothetical protein
MLDLAHLRTRLEAQLAAVAEAEAALAKVQALCGSQARAGTRRAAIAVSGPAVPGDPSERVLAAATPQHSATRTCPGCGGPFERVAPAQRYCDPGCRTKQRNERASLAKRARADAEWQERTAQLRQLHEKEGFGAQSREMSNGKAEEGHAL